MKKRSILFVILGSALTFPALGQVQAGALVARPIDEARQFTLHGSVHPLAQPGNDLGAVPDSFQTNRLLLLLNRPQERQFALQQFLQDAHNRESAGYHKWLTPEQFGARFGPADADIQTAAGWLSSHGFHVSKTSKSHQFIEFSGTSGALREAFHTEIHRYNVNGETHYANASEVKIPEALAPLVKGLSPLNDFRAKPDVRVLGQAFYSPSNHRATPLWTLPNGSQQVYALAPEDFATQYDLAPLYKAGTNGAGQTIGIINESNINLSLVEAYQKLFSLNGSPVRLVIDGSDPGDLQGVDIEAYLDVEQAGAVAPDANVILYIANPNGLFTGSPESASAVDPLYLSALRAVDDNEAGVLSVSFGNCEGFLLASGNGLWSELWQQAAAQGQTVVVSSGDSGSAGCDNGTSQWTTEYGIAVNGLASTPWNVAVGGTDFYYSDYASGGASAATLWNQTNDSAYGSLKAPLPEQVWDTVYGFNSVGPYVQNGSESIPAGGGGASGCIDSAEAPTSGGLPFVCNAVAESGWLYGYGKPSWQTGTGAPADGVRDLPDVSLFAALGTNMSGYPICAVQGDCVPDSRGNEQVTMVGGTSAAAPAMAAIMALVNQKYGRQGQANFTLYPLAHQVPGAFHDITLGGNNMTCLQGSPGCSLDTNGDGFYSLQKYSATPGYDLASGLGSIDASVLVNNWNSISFKPTTTTLQLSPTTGQAGTRFDVNFNVKPSSGSGTPLGSVTLLAGLSSSSAPPFGIFTLSGGSASGTVTNLPGGTYEVWAEYGGDGSFAASRSAAQTVTITPTGSTVNLYGFEVPGQTLDPAAPCLLNSNQNILEQSTNFGPWSPWPSGSSFAGSQVAPVAIVNAAWPSFGNGTGSVTFSVDGAPQATVALNSLGYAGWIPPSTFNAGTHTIGATYSGDASFDASTATPYTLIVPKVTPALSVWPAASCTGLYGGSANCTFTAGDDLYVEVRITQANCHVPTGALTVNLGSLSQNVTLIQGGLVIGDSSIIGTPVLSGEAVFKDLPAGTYNLVASYAGDANSLANSSDARTILYGQYGQGYTLVAKAPSTPAPLLASTTTVPFPPSWDNVVWSSFSMTATVSGPAGSTTPPTGTVVFFDDGLEISSGTLTPAGANTSTVTAWVYDGMQMDLGSSQLKAVYSGDGVYQSSETGETFSATLSITPDFLLAPQQPQISLQAGGTATSGFNLASLGGFNGNVNLTCTPSSSQITCSLNPATVTVNGQATTTLTIKAVAQSAGLVPPRRQQQSRWPAAAGILSLGLFLIGGRTHRKLRQTMLLSVCMLASLLTISCGGGGASTTAPTPAPAPAPPTPAAVAYNVVVTATANGIAHNATINVLVR